MLVSAEAADGGELQSNAPESAPLMLQINIARGKWRMDTPYDDNFLPTPRAGNQDVQGRKRRVDNLPGCSVIVGHASPALRRAILLNAPEKTHRFQTDLPAMAAAWIESHKARISQYDEELERTREDLDRQCRARVGRIS